MITWSSQRTRRASLSRKAATTLVESLVEEMTRLWRHGEHPLPEDFLAKHPALWEHPEAAAELIYEECCLRQEYGPEVPMEQVLNRFPQWRPQLEVLLDCQGLLEMHRTLTQFPAADESLGDFLLVAELGRGAEGRVFLASQLSLGCRPVVLKFLPCENHEHLSLARLQHTHIVPLYSVEDHPARGIRALCMPYFGGVAVAQLLEALRSKPPAERAGRDLLDALDRLQAGTPLVAPAGGPARQILASASYVRAICWIGTCLADALQYAHERGLVHLDLKPSNVLLAADGQPMLLDFHLARGPIHPGGQEPQWLGGTAGYMSPEQQGVLRAIQQGRKADRSVDHRSDIYSLGVLLYEALGGGLPVPVEKPRPLHRTNPRVSIGLADVVGKCLAEDPDDRYPQMAALGADLRRHLNHLLLTGVRNRSLMERWRKWRCRRPHGIALAALAMVILTAAGAAAVMGTSYVTQRTQQAGTALNDGQRQLANGEWEGAIHTLRRGLSAAHGIPFRRDLIDDLHRRLWIAELQAQAAANRAAATLELHRLADRVRFLFFFSTSARTDEAIPESELGLAASCRALWENRNRFLEGRSPSEGTHLEPAVHDDLLDLAIFWADLQVRLAPPTDRSTAREKALSILAQAEAMFGPSRVLVAERRIHGASGQRIQGAPRRSFGCVQHASLRTLERAPDTPWMHYALSRSFLRSGHLKRAAEEAERAVRLQPQGLWPNFYQGLTAYCLGRYEDAATAYSVCIGAAPEAAGCFFNRALAFEALGRTERALQDYDQALRLEPTLAVAVLNRGRLHDRAGHHDAALSDLHRARKLGADPAVVLLHLAMVNLAPGVDHRRHQPIADDVLVSLVRDDVADDPGARPIGAGRV
jgi:tetratricopeptide (TPR) repeat protein